MATFRVDPEELTLLAGRMDALRESLRSSHGAALLVTGLRSPRVDVALEDFESEWSDGMAIIRNQLEECAVRLRASADEYRSADACIARAVTPGGGAD